MLAYATSPTLPNETYTYDPLGKRKSAAGVTGTWSYNYNSELLSHGDASFAHDDNGNMITRTIAAQDTSFIYDEGDRMVEVQDHNGATTAAYDYDPFGRRLWKDVGGVKTYYFYSDEGLVGEYDSSGTEIKTYGYAIGSQWGTNPLYQKVGTTYYWYHNDHLGTPQKVTDTTGTVVWSAVYDSFGKATVETSTITNNLRFPGQYYDAETDLHYNWNRYYDTATGRYMRPDPLEQNVGVDLYRYVNNNPIRYIDPEGLIARSAVKKVREKAVSHLKGSVSFDFIAIGGTLGVDREKEMLFVKGRVGVTGLGFSIDPYDRILDLPEMNNFKRQDSNLKPTSVSWNKFNTGININANIPGILDYSKNLINYDTKTVISQSLPDEDSLYGYYGSEDVIPGKGLTSDFFNKTTYSPKSSYRSSKISLGLKTYANIEAGIAFPTP
ncbi:MAG: hypothetical protein HOI47_21350 [Candidatus Scalindua sp.]|jgi:RHS repeat-associated protein|nr:hypothetical protein [Candidatus Scalindua sp.]MBT6229197.1 hypothetical protein [Candidatus Scalindua sp.]